MQKKKCTFPRGFCFQQPNQSPDNVRIIATRYISYKLDVDTTSCLNGTWRQICQDARELGSLDICITIPRQISQFDPESESEL